jgi:ubiquinone/menaquinone biosynthesis C-methylase UbiE
MQKVQKVGCGTGRNFPYLREAIGPTRRIYGVDLSAGMLRKARKLSVGASVAVAG